jgi:predicted regulator of Ras-like GTPase activity (Roadblock/LC7/MglB family)
MSYETVATSKESNSFLTEDQKVSFYMDNVFSQIMRCNQNVNCMVVSKNGKYLKTNLPKNKALEHVASIIDFRQKCQVLVNKLLPDEPIENIRIKATKEEVFVTFDELVEIIVIDTNQIGR